MVVCDGRVAVCGIWWLFVVAGGCLWGRIVCVCGGCICAVDDCVLVVGGFEVCGDGFDT